MHGVACIAWLPCMFVTALAPLAGALAAGAVRSVVLYLNCWACTAVLCFDPW
jgi:hypothetical protein